MTVRGRLNLVFSVSSQAQPEDKDLGNLKMELLVDAQDEGGGFKTIVPASSTNVELNFPEVDALRVIAIRTKAKVSTDTAVPLSFKLDDVGKDPFVVAPPDDGKEGLFVLTTPGVSTIFCTNAGTVAMEVTLVVLADSP